MTEKELGRRALYSIGGADSPVTPAPNRVTLVGGARDPLSRAQCATRRLAPPSRPPLAADVIALIERMTRDNPTWSRRRIAAELAKLGHEVGKDAVAKYMPKRTGRPGRPPSTTWRKFVRMHLEGTIAIDFLTVPTVTFYVLYVFFVLPLPAAELCMST